MSRVGAFTRFVRDRRERIALGMSGNRIWRRESAALCAGGSEDGAANWSEWRHPPEFAVRAPVGRVPRYGKGLVPMPKRKDVLDAREGRDIAF